MLRTWIRALRQNHLDVTLRVGSGVSARIIERPGLWMGGEEQVRLVGELRTVAEGTVAGGSLDYGVLTGDKDRLDHAIVTLLRDTKTGKPIAFNALSAMDLELHGRPVEVVHLGLVMVAPGVRSQGFSWVLYGLTCLILFARQQLRPLWLSNVTQVPAIVGMVSESFSDVFPKPDTPQPATSARRSFEHLLLARQIMKRHRAVFGAGAEAGFDEQRFVITNAYTGGSDNLKKTFEQAPKHRDAIYNDFCATQLDYGRGDDLLQLCKLDLAAAQRFILKDVPRSSWPAVASTLAVIALNRLVLPIIYWLAADKPWGILRPAKSTGQTP